MRVYVIALLSIIFLAFVLRLYKIDQIPASLNQDETALGYNAYSLFKTGADEHGKFFPLSLESFGDWKLQGYPLADIPFVAMFGLTEIAVRLPSALSGTISCFLLYAICTKLFKRKSVGLFAALFLAISPWSIYFSRMAYEVNLATCFFLGGLLLLLTEFGEKQTAKLVIAAILFGLTLFTYHSFLLFTPLFLFSFMLLKRKIFFELVEKKNTFLIFAMVFFFCFLFVAYFSTFFGSTTKLSNTSVFSDPNLVFTRMGLRADAAKEPAVIKHLLYNKVTGGLYQIGQNYLSTFSPAFLFDKGGVKVLNSLGWFGNFYLIDALFLAIGISALFYKREKSIPLILIWVLTAPVPSAITQDAPSATRLYPLLPILLIIAAYGASFLFSFQKQSLLSTICKLIIFVLFACNILYFLEGYFLHVNVQRAEFFHYGYKQIVSITNQYPKYHVVMVGPENFPYISFLFYNKYDPKIFQKEVVYYPRTTDGFLPVKSFNRYQFVNDIDYIHLQQKTIFIDLAKPKALPKNVNVQTIFLPSEKSAFWYFVY